MEFGVDLAKTGVAIQESVRDQILAMTGNHAKNIDVINDDIKVDTADKEEIQIIGLRKRSNKTTSLE